MVKRFLIGALWGTRTLGLLVRSQSLYPAELTTHSAFFAQRIYYHIKKALSRESLEKNDILISEQVTAEFVPAAFRKYGCNGGNDCKGKPNHHYKSPTEVFNKMSRNKSERGGS